MPNRKKILAISGSTRNNSANEAILNLISSLHSDVLDVQIYNGIINLPYFNPDTDNDQVAPEVLKFRALIAAADGVIICTPEYVFSLPGALKNAIEWTVSTTVFSNKPVALIVASGLGDKAFESLILIMNTLQAKIGASSKLLISGARSKLNAEQKITDPQTLNGIELLVNSLLESITNN